MLELLAPAGSMEALQAAVQNGADAVYLGVGAYNARQGAKNFTLETLPEAVRYCHVRGVAVHLTVNTLVGDRELSGAARLIAAAADCGIDAFIVQDLGILELCRQIAPHVPLHASTQMTVHSLWGVQMCAQMGFSRVVLSRELSREEIRNICRQSPVEIEVFGHGALCMCYSGQCYLSAAIGGRSGNRGSCAQPCRQPYGAGKFSQKYPLSLKDNCLVQSLEELKNMGVASLKLEGRMKRPEYVAAVTGVYRRALDTGRVTPVMMNTLAAAFNRQGFTDGYYAGNPGSHMFGIREDRTDGAFLRQMRQTYEGAEQPLVDVRFQFVMEPDRCVLSVADGDNRVCTAVGPAPEAARSVMLTEDDVAQRLAKTGGTPYRSVGTLCKLIPGMTVSAAVLNGLRRDALAKLTALRGRTDAPRTHRAKKPVIFPGSRRAPELTVQVTSREQITPKLLRAKPAVLYVPLHILAADLEFCKALTARAKVCAVLPRICHDGEFSDLCVRMNDVRGAGVGELLAGNLGYLPAARAAHMDVRGDFGLNLYNSRAVNTARELGLTSCCLSFEMNMGQIQDVSKAVPCEVLAYGRLPLMVTENCIVHSAYGKCSCNNSTPRLVDKTGADFPVIRDGDSCRSVLLNGKKLYMLDRRDEWARTGVWATRLYFTTENAREVDRILDDFRDSAPFDHVHTRGLYLRGLQ